MPSHAAQAEYNSRVGKHCDGEAKANQQTNTVILITLDMSLEC